MLRKRSFGRRASALTVALGLALTAALPLRADPIISEFMAANSATLADDDGAFSDWIELHNPDATPVNLDGWYLTDSAGNKTKWRLPAVTLPPGGYLVVFASNKDRANPAQGLHTNFALGASGEYLGLVKPDGVTVASEFAPEFPAQTDDVSYGHVTLPDGTSAVGFLRTATPGAPNGDHTALMLPETVTVSRASGPFTGTITIELSGAGPGQKIRYTLLSGAGAGAAELTSQANEYTGPLVLSTTAVLRAAVFSDDDTLRGRETAAHYLRLHESLAGFSSQLPVLVLDSLGAGPLEMGARDVWSWAYGYSAAPAGQDTFAAAPVHRTPLEATVRGNSSAEFPKKGYNIKLRDSRGGARQLPLFQLPAYEKWSLVAPWSFDQNYINNPFGYALSNRIGRWAARTQMVEVFFNGGGDDLELSDYAGIYVLTDRILPEPGRVEIPELSPSTRTEPALTGGYIIKLDQPDPDEFGWRTANNIPDDTYSAVVLVSPQAEDANDEQRAYIQDYVQRMEDALFRDRDSGWSQRTYLDYIDRASWVDHHILNVLVSNPDSFVRSAYFHKPRGGKLIAGPVWDLDRALGGNWDYRGETARTWSGSFEPDVDFWRSGWWGVLAQDPEFMQEWIDRWQSLRRTEFSNRSLLGLVDSLAATVGPEAAARDAARWPDNEPPSGSYAGQIAELKSWLQRRAEWIDTQFLAPPEVSDGGGSLTFIPPAGAQLAFTLDGSDPRALGGDLAANATLSSAPLTVPANTNVQVRSYRADLRGTFPGSPWSSAIGGPTSTPLRPAARIINISTRALVGRGENALITGVVVADTEQKRYLARGIGPALANFGASGVVADPQLSIVAQDGVELFRNNGWETGPDAARIPGFARAVGAFPLTAGSADSALAVPLAAGSYTVQVTTPTGQDGIGLAELYELDGNGRTANLSTRAYVREGDGALIGGFVVSGAAHKRVLIRAVGPTLRAFGIVNALSDSEVTVYTGTSIVATNDRWDAAENASAVATAARNVGAFALAAGSEDAALLITLPAAPYTVEVRGKAGNEGVALLEIYELP